VSFEYRHIYDHRFGEESTYCITLLYCGVMFRVNSYGPLDREMVTLQHCCWKFSHKETL